MPILAVCCHLLSDLHKTFQVVHLFHSLAILEQKEKPTTHREDCTSKKIPTRYIFASAKLQTLNQINYNYYEDQLH